MEYAIFFLSSGVRIWLAFSQEDPIALVLTAADVVSSILRALAKRREHLSRDHKGADEGG